MNSISSPRYIFTFISERFPYHHLLYHVQNKLIFFFSSIVTSTYNFERLIITSFRLYGCEVWREISWNKALFLPRQCTIFRNRFSFIFLLFFAHMFYSSYMGFSNHLIWRMHKICNEASTKRFIVRDICVMHSIRSPRFIFTCLFREISAAEKNHHLLSLTQYLPVHISKA